MDYEITIKFDSKNNQTLIKGSNLGNWMDLGLAIEGLGVLMAIERNEKKFESAKEKGIETKEQLAEYVKKYIDEVSNDYDKSFAGIPTPFVV